MSLPAAEQVQAVVGERLAAHGLKIIDVPERGRALVATRHFAKGDEVWSEAAATQVGPLDGPLASGGRDVCHNCKRGVDKLRRCSGCKFHLYCSPECQRAAWTAGGHKKVCKALCALLAEVPRASAARDTAAMALHVVLVGGPGAVEQFAMLDPGTVGFPEASVLAMRAAQHGRAAPLDLAAWTHLCLVIDNNMFNFHTDGLRGMLTEFKGVFFACSFLNHACFANCARGVDVKDGEISMSLFAKEDIAAGDELTTEYFYGHKSAALRREIMSSFGFTCTCARCTTPDETLDKLLEEMNVLYKETLTKSDYVQLMKICDRIERIARGGDDKQPILAKHRHMMAGIYQVRMYTGLAVGHMDRFMPNYGLFKLYATMGRVLAIVDKSGGSPSKFQMLEEMVQRDAKA